MKRLQMVGLIDPIVVTDNLTLIAGARLLEAMERLGATMIEVRRVGDLSELEQRIIELHENSDRKDLTPVERSRIQVEPASAVASH
jgi:ParB-like chromosome segregation protein Spo0J